MNSKVEDYLERAESDLIEWKEQFGDQFPIFLNHFFVARLLKAEDEILYLRRAIKHMEKK